MFCPPEEIHALNALTIVNHFQQHTLDDVAAMACLGNPVVVFHVDSTRTSLDVFAAYMSSVMENMKVFNVYVWYDSSQFSISDSNGSNDSNDSSCSINNDMAFDMGATFYNHGI
ncbi:hypothetical protein GGI21_003135, partial [Coemansia aciculifera]